MSETYVGSLIENKNDTGIIKDKNGYYKISFGLVNALNVSGVFFMIKDMDAMFKTLNTVIGRRIHKGIVEAESNHPDFNGLSGDALVNKILDIDKNNVCGKIKGVSYVKTGDCVPGFEEYPTYEIFGWVKPAGPNGKYLQEALEDRLTNVVFSIRSIAIPFNVGMLQVREIIDIGAWDWVHDPGYPTASQWHVAGLESYDGGINLCMDGSCATKLEKGMLTGAVNSTDDIRTIVEGIKRRTHNYDPILDLE